MARTKSSAVKPAQQVSWRAVEAAVTEHAAAIGRIAIAWNRLHETMGGLFAQIVNSEDLRPGYAVWHALKSDRSQRDILRALAKTHVGVTKRVADEIVWGLGRMQGREDDRNNAVHAPYMTEGVLRIVPNALTGNTRATQLVGRDLAAEFESCEHNIAALDDFMHQLRALVQPASDSMPLPPKPPL